ncbi:hypothetical protein BT63DRAFT_424021 [Microthyrium microscopicum]|uniref:F-box domain-containing protein n=1 Tax=Microthyrium microscopicum TaxID=703497 RepID=A0A6A6UD29_9PEZI|nr:hypothetical protein BT63DRAFT_424021 [Microthyrium microscopicum]
MDRLPLEIFEQITSYLWREKEDTRDGPTPVRVQPALANLACVSAQYQQLVEQQTFNYIHLRSTELEAFEKIFQQKSRRQTCLKTLDFHVMLPKYGQSQWARYVGSLVELTDG